MDWTEEKDVYLCREIIVREPFKYKKGSVDKGRIWTEIADSLNSCKELQFKVTQRSVRERFSLIQSRFQKQTREEIASSGTAPDVTELDVLLEEIGEKEKIAEEINETAKKKAETDRGRAEQIRDKAMKRMETKQKNENGEESGVKSKKRRSGNDTIEYLKEKSKIEKEMREKELDLKKLEVEQQGKTMNDMISVLKQQNQTLMTLLANSLKKSD